MVYAIAMRRTLRTSLLILVLLLEGLGTALAMPPVTAAPVDEVHTPAAMPCHDDGGTQAEMPCCDDGGDCRCSMNCFGASSALAPARAELALPLRRAGDGHLHPPALLPAHPQRLLRPPASSLA